MQTIQEHRVIGPPGCGKTTWLGRQVERAVNAGESVLIASLTRAAASEVAGRHLPLPEENVGTLHAHCYRSLGRPEIAETKAKYIEDWNKTHPGYALTVKRRDIDEDNTEPSAESLGDEMMARYQVLRARMLTVLPPDVHRFADAWKAWKEANDLVDFTDLIELSVHEVSTAPGSPSVLFIDEAQDMDALEMALVRKWGERAGYLVVVGDPDQNLYLWRGSDPGAFTNSELPDEQKMVLEQSFRVPSAIHSVAVRWINQIKARKPVNYHPRDAEGEVRRIEATWKHAEPLMKDVDRQLTNGRSVMLLASCSYMLRPLISVLRQTGIPFHNPYRRNRGDWNPLATHKNQVTAAERIISFMHLSESGKWTAEDMKWWTEVVAVEAVLPGGRDGIDVMYDADDMGVPRDVLNYLVSEEAINAGLGGDLDWYQSHLLAKKKEGASFPCKVVAKGGVGLLLETPKVVVGTIHSVKGGEADVVYLMPDLSRAGMAQWVGTDIESAAIRRLFYVGMTRARDSLVLCNPAGRMAVQI